MHRERQRYYRDAHAQAADDGRHVVRRVEVEDVAERRGACGVEPGKLLRCERAIRKGVYACV